MKKYLSVIAAFAAVLSSVSCTKELATEEIVIPQDRVVTFEASLDDLTKLYFGDTANMKMPLYWNSGDAFKLITTKSQKYYRDTLKKSVTYKDLTDCGNFTTTQDGVTKAYFTGAIPAGAVGSRDGIAIFPASAYNDTSAYVTYDATVTKCATGLRSTIPSVQDGTGAKYVVAVAGLVNGTLSKFQCMTPLIKLKVKAGSGVDRIILSCPDTSGFGIAGTLGYYYYWKADGSFGSIANGVRNVGTTIEVYRNGEELSGDIYIATRSIKNIATARQSGPMKLTLRFVKGDSLSKAYSWTPDKEYGGSSIVTFKGEFDPDFSGITSIKMTTALLKESATTLVPSYADTVAGEKFPWITGKGSSTYVVHNVSTKDTLSQKWFRTERTYTYGGYEWGFGSTYEKTDSKLGLTGKWGFHGEGQLRIEGSSYIKLPVVSGKKLVAVSCAINNSSAYQVWYRISPTKSYDKKTVMVPDTRMKIIKDKPHLVLVFDAAKNTPYYLVGAGSWMPNKLILYYQ